MQHEDNEVQSAAYEVSILNANIEHISGKENYIADFLSQKDKRNKNPDDVVRLLVGIVDDEDIVIE